MSGATRPLQSAPSFGSRSAPSPAGSLDFAALIAALLVAMLVIIGFSYPFLLDRGPLSARLTASNVLLLHGGGLLFGTGLVAAVAARRTALAVSMFFCFVFFFIASREQVLGGFDMILEDQDIVHQALILCLAFALVVLAVNAIPLAHSPPSGELDPRPRSPATLLLVLLAGCALQAAFVALLGPTLVSTRGELAAALLANFGKPATALISNFLFSFFFFLPVVALLGYRPRRWDLVRFVSLVSLALGCLINNPLVHPRFYFGALAIGTVLLIADPRRTGSALLVTGVATLAAPLLNVFRDMWAWQNVNPQLGLAALQSFDFDAFTSICYGLMYSKEHGSMYGTNILGSLLFFVPSAAWPDKPEYTGGLLYETVVRRFRLESPDNLSAPIPIEGYLAFGWLGVVALSLAFALTVRWLDGAPRLSRLGARSLCARALCLAYSPALVIYLVRGSLMPTFAYTVGMFSAIALAVYLVRSPFGRSTLAAPRGGWG